MDILKTFTLTGALATIIFSYTPLEQSNEPTEYRYVVSDIQNDIIHLEPVYGQQEQPESIVLFEDDVPSNTQSGHVISVLWDDKTESILQVMNHGNAF